jgi:hypothetical protein
MIDTPTRTFGSFRRSVREPVNDGGDVYNVTLDIYKAYRRGYNQPSSGEHEVIDLVIGDWKLVPHHVSNA